MKKMKCLSALLLGALLITLHSTAQDIKLKSPDKRMEVKVQLKDGQLFYTVSYRGKVVMQPSQLGISRTDGDFYKDLKWNGNSMSARVNESYPILNGKKSTAIVSANKQLISVKNAIGDEMQVLFQVSNDGIAFRYYFPGKTTSLKYITKEHTSFHFYEGTRTWLQPKAEAQSGWEHTNPSYEAHYMMDIKTGTPAPGANGWVYPAMFKYGDTWMLITEAAIGRTYCGTSLQQYSPDNEYKINFPQSAEKFTNGALNPQAVLPWESPWRVIAIGELKTIVESTLGTDLALPSTATDYSYIKPGRASWSWIMSKDDYIIFSEQKKYIDYAADMGWEYCLVDAAWDKKIGYDSIQILADYAASKKVGLILWYNSAGSWNTVKYTPKDLLLTHEGRMKEFGRIHKMGIKGVKVDFFAGDGQSMINYYQDILEDAAANQLLVNFHGATLPRGWHRTYPNLMTTEAVYGYEMITFNQKDADVAGPHMVMSAFARNAFDPMDFTPVSLYKIPGKERRTSPAFELATSVIFLSGIQHFVEGPEGMATVEPEVKKFMQQVPVTWDETIFLDGYPGKSYTVARRSGKKWYVAGVNADSTELALQLDFPFVREAQKGQLFTMDNGVLKAKEYTAALRKGHNHFFLKPNDGFVLVFEE